MKMLIKKSLLTLSVLAVAGVLASCVAPTENNDTASNYIDGFSGTPLARSATDLDGKSTTGYLAARFAQRHGDWETASNYMLRAYEQDKQSPMLLQRVFLLSLGSGDFSRASQLANDVLATKENTEIADLFLGCQAIEKGDFDGAQKRVSNLPDSGFGQFSKPLLNAWIQAGKGNFKQALELLKPAKGAMIDPSYAFHSGLITDLSGDAPTAKEFFKQALAQGMNVNNSLLIADFFRRQGDEKISSAIDEGFDKLSPFGSIDTNPQSTKNASVVKDASQGAALAMFELASALFERKAYDSALIYARLTQTLDPSAEYVSLMLGDTLARQGHYDDALQKYSSVGEKSSLYWLSRLRSVETYEMSGHVDQAVDMLTKLSQDKPEFRSDAMVYLGDLYRKNEQYDKAVNAYNEAFSAIKEIKPSHWALFYARGIALERANDWTMAEKDLLKALELRPDHPMILNYLGYTWADKGVRLDEAEKMLKRAVALRPDDGYILDSYGWALYRMGRPEEAIVWLERAIEKVPGDFTVNDHLGDVMFASNRVNEAMFQWQRAVKLAETDEERLSAQAKIDSRGASLPITRKMSGK